MKNMICNKFLKILFVLFVFFALASFTNNYSTDSNVTIENYESQFWAKNVGGEVGKIINVYEDDDIINIIPKELFFKEQRTWKQVDDNYLYFISTDDKVNFFLADVMFIKIEESVDLENVEHPSQIVQKIIPIFNTRYVGMIDTNDLYINNYLINNIFGGKVVLPYVAMDGDFKVKSATLGITNVNFYATLANTRHLNSNDSSYIASDDKGSFFTRSDIYFNGRSGIDIGSQVSLIKNIIGFIPSGYPIDYGDVISSFDTIDNIKKVIETGEIREEASYGEFFKNIAYASAKEQVENYGALVKFFF